MVSTHVSAAEWPVTWCISLSLALPSPVSYPLVSSFMVRPETAPVPGY